MITKSGGNKYHGELYEYFRNNPLDANGYFSDGIALPDYRQNQFGIAFGGADQEEQAMGLDWLFTNVDASMHNVYIHLNYS